MTPNTWNLRPDSRDHFSCQARQTDRKGTIHSLDHFWKQTKFFSKNNTFKDIAIKKLNIVNVSKPSIINFRLEENSRADRRVNEPGQDIALPHRGKWQELTNVRIAFSKRLRQHFPQVRNSYLLRRETCSVFHDIFENFLRTFKFFPYWHFQFWTKLFPIVPQQKHHAKPFELK